MSSGYYISNKAFSDNNTKVKVSKHVFEFQQLNRIKSKKLFIFDPALQFLIGIFWNKKNAPPSIVNTMVGWKQNHTCL